LTADQTATAEARDIKKKKDDKKATRIAYMAKSYPKVGLAKGGKVKGGEFTERLNKLGRFRGTKKENSACGFSGCRKRQKAVKQQKKAKKKPGKDVSGLGRSRGRRGGAGKKGGSRQTGSRGANKEVLVWGMDEEKKGKNSFSKKSDTQVACKKEKMKKLLAGRREKKTSGRGLDDDGAWQLKKPIGAVDESEARAKKGLSRKKHRGRQGGGNGETE